MQVNHPAEVTHQDTHAFQWWQDWAHRITVLTDLVLLFLCAMSKVAELSFVLHGRWDTARLFKVLPFMGQILCLATQPAPLRVYRSGKCVFPKVAEAERSSKERLTEGGGDSRPMSGVFSQRGFWKFAFWLLGKEDTHGNGGTCHTSLGKVSDRVYIPPELLSPSKLFLQAKWIPFFS